MASNKLGDGILMLYGKDLGSKLPDMDDDLIGYGKHIDDKGNAGCGICGQFA